MSGASKWRFIVSAPVFALLIAGCDTPAPSEAPVNSPPEARLFLTAGGNYVPEDVMEQRLDRFTRALSIVLADDNRRAELYESLRKSPFREGKVHLRTVLSTEWSDMLGDIARVSRESVSQLLMGLDSVIDLEVYLPVPEHRRAWQGGRNLIVAYYTADDGRAPSGFMLGGTPVHAFTGDASDELEHTACAGESISGERYWDWDELSPSAWVGEVLVASEAELADGVVEFQVFEDDTNPCMNPKVDYTTAYLITLQTDDNADVQLYQNPVTIDWWRQAIDLGLYVNETGANDDWVGTIQWPHGGCWPATGPVLAPIDLAGAPTGRTYLTNTFGERDPICPTVTISGPTSISTSGDYQWTANPSDGVGGYTYTWYRKTDHWWPRDNPTCHHETVWQMVGSAQTYSTHVSTWEYDFQLKVVVHSGPYGADETTNVLVGDGRPCPEVPH